MINSIYDLKMNDYDGKEVDFSIYKNKVLLIVNTATICGFTKQYDDLVYLYEQHKDKGFEILDFPCSQFLNQAPGTSKEIHEACYLRFLIGFPQFEKIKVNGKEECELYTYLKNNDPTNDTPTRIKWNFTKFLVDRNGNVINRYEPAINPRDIEKDIVALLEKEN